MLTFLIKKCNHSSFDAKFITGPLVFLKLNPAPNWLAPLRLEIFGVPGLKGNLQG